MRKPRMRRFCGFNVYNFLIRFIYAFKAPDSPVVVLLYGLPDLRNRLFSLMV